MPHTIKTILDNFTKKYEAFELCEIICKKDHDDLKQFLQEELTGMLESISKKVEENFEVREHLNCGDRECMYDGKWCYHFTDEDLEELINIINSHK